MTFTESSIKNYILNAFNIHSNEVTDLEIIPDEFTDPYTYQSTFYPLLLHETIKQLKNSYKLLVINIDLHLHSHYFQFDSNSDFEFKANDVFYVVFDPSSSIRIPRNAGYFVFVVENVDDDSCLCHVSYSDMVNDIPSVQSNEVSFYYLGNIGKTLNIENAINNSGNDSPIVNAVLRADYTGISNAYLPTDTKLIHLFHKLNKKQLAFVCTALTQSNPVCVLSGPPASGKSFTLTVLTVALLESDSNVVFLNPSMELLLKSVEKLLKCINENDCVDFLQLNNLLIYDDQTDCTNLNSDSLMHSLLLSTRITNICTICSDWLSAYRELINLIHFQWTDSQVQSIEESECIWQDFTIRFNTSYETYQQSSSALMNLWETSPDALLCDEFGNQIKLTNFTKLSNTVDSFVDLFDTLKPFYTRLNDHFIDILLNRSNTTTMSRFFDELFQSGIVKIKTLLSSFDDIEQKCISLSSNQSRKLIRHCLLTETKCIFSTITSTPNLSSVFENHPVVILDQAVQVTEIETLQLLQFESIGHLVMAGDIHQLHARGVSETGRQYKYDRSLFERLMIIPYPRTTLNIQYQIHPDIMIWSNQYFYDSQIITHSSVKKTSKWYENSIFGPIKIFELPGNEQVAGHTSSLSNLLEAKLVVLMLTRFVKLYPDLRLTVGIITLYTAQKRLIESLVVKAGKIKNDTLCIGGLRIDINHPMALQGCSRDIIILSTVRSNSRGDIGSYGIAHLLNFIITRACRSLWIIADFRTFQKNVVWKSLIDCLTKAGCHQVCSADKGFKTTIRHEGVLMAIKDKNMTELEILGAVWTMIFTKKSKTSISKLPKELLPPLISKLIALSSGTLKFRYSSDEFQVFQITVKTYTIICTVALESALEYYHQVIQLWDIVPNNLASKSLDDIRKVLLSRTSEYLEKCRESKTDQIENHVVRTPITFMKSNHPIQFYKNTKSTDFSEVQSQEISEDVTDMVKVYQMNQTVLDCIRDQKLSTMEFPFVLGVQEISLVEYGESAFILGRSGTGKTTVMLSKMMVQEGLYLDMVDYKDLSPPTQWMITCNNRLKDTSEKYYKKLRLSKKELNDTTQPSFWSFFEFLVMLDEKLPNAFFIKVQNADDQLEFRDAMIDEHNQTAEYLTGFYQLKSIVTFEKFITQYFPRISDALTSKYSASIVWTEIQSYIKGSISIVKNSDLSRQYLPLEEYITLSQCRVSVLNDSDRKNIYQIWQAYERLKRLNHQYDIADLTINVYHRVSSQPYKTTVDYLYLDEVQDMTQIQIGLFKYVCFNKNGFVFAGDTAQTISSGVGFRFEDVRKLFYEHFLDSTVVNLPQIWYLTQNYRTHSGILKLSSTLVDLMVHFFPNAVDKVEAENGALIEGNLPSFLVGSSREDLFVQLFGAENSRKESVHREMGAEQVIIVRTEEAKLELSKLIGSALILTVYESKGLEFDDVLIYNFFADSTFKRWRNVLSQIDIDDYDSKIDNRLHRFDEKQDHQLCHELKALYVATTRAKCRLWFFDESDPQNAMVEYWSQKECLLLITPTTSHLHFATTSSKESWQQRGDEFFERLQYEQAIVCFDRAGDVKQSSRAKALILIRQAEIFHSQGKKRIVNEMFLKAALIFQSINDLSMAANCYVKVNDFENAALLFWECGDFSKSLASCLHAKLSHLALDLLKKDKSKLNSSNLEKYSRFFAVQCQTNHTMMLEFLSFVSNAAARSFLSRYKYYTLLYNFDKKHNNCLNLAESALNLGYYDECFSNYIQGNQPSKAMDIALRYFLRPKVLLILKGCRKFKNHSFECKYQVVLTKIREFFEKNSFLDYSFGIEVKFILIIIEMESCATLEAFVKKHTLMPHLNLISDMILFNQLNQENNDDRLPDSKEFAVRILQRISSTVAYLNSSRQNQEPLTGFATYYPLDMSYSFADTYKQIFSEYTTLNRISFINFVTLQLTYMKKKLVNQIIGRLEKCTNSLTLCSTVRSKQDCRNPICSFEHNQQIFKSKFPIFLQRKLDIVDIFQIVGHDKTVYNFDRIVQSIIQLMFPNNNVDNDAKPLLLFIVNPKIQFLCECYVRSHLTTHELKTDVQSVMLSFFSRSRAPIDSKTGDLVHELQNAFHWSMEKGNTISVVFYTKYLSSFLTILLKQNVPDLSPHFFLDLMEQYLSSFIALSTSFGLKHKPIGTYLSSIYAYHLHHFQSFNLENFNRKFNDADLVITRLIDYLRDDGEYFRVWFTKYSKENWGTKILMYQRLIRAILLVFLNMPHFHSQLIDLFTNPGFLKFLTKEYQFLGINPIVSLLQEKINSQSPEKEDKTWNSKFYIAIVEYFKFHSDNIYFFSWKKRLGIKYARPLFITEDRVKLSLKHFINCDENRVMNFTEDDDEEEDSSITKVDDDYNQMGGEESNSSMEKIATLSPWILTRLRNIKNRVTKRVELQQRTDLTAIEKLQVQSKILLCHLDDAVQFHFLNTILPVLADIQTIRDTIYRCVSVLSIRHTKHFKFSATGWGIEESTEMLYSYMEKLESFLDLYSVLTYKKDHHKYQLSWDKDVEIVLKERPLYERLVQTLNQL